VPTTCNSVNICGTRTKKGSILIRPTIAAPRFQFCTMSPSPNFPTEVPISESLLTLLQANNFDASKVFTDDQNDKTKWRIGVRIATNCDENCEQDGTRIGYHRFFSQLTDYEIVPINTSNTPGFAIKLNNVPVSDLANNKNRNLQIDVYFIEPCVNHLSCMFCQSNSPSLFRGTYSASESMSNVIDGQEIRLTPLGGIGSDANSCTTCQ
jgi:hypothetical protein